MFEWNRIHKYEDNIEMQVSDSVFEYVTEFYGVDDIEELTEAQVDEITYFRDHELNEYSLMQIGFSNIISSWESMQ